MKNYFAALLLLCIINVSGQSGTTNSGDNLPEKDSASAQIDTVRQPVILLSPDSSALYIKKLLKTETLWRTNNDSLQKSLENLIINYQTAYNHAKKQLTDFEYDSIRTIDTVLVKTDSLKLRWLNDSTMFIDTILLAREPFIIKKTIIKKIIDTTEIPIPDTIDFSQLTPLFYSQLNDSLANTYVNDSLINSIRSIIFDAQNNLVDKAPNDSISTVEEGIINAISFDTITNIIIDTAYLKSQNIQLYHVKDDYIDPLPIGESRNATYSITADKKSMVVSDSILLRLAPVNTPFYHIPGEYTTDSLKIAVNTLITHIFKRDSIEIFIRDKDGRKTPYWLSANNNGLYRIWVKNYRNDSITIWMGNPEKHDITLFLEEEVQIDRPEKQPVEQIPVLRRNPESNLVKIEPLELIPVYWDRELSTLFSFNQTYLANWVKGGESSISTLIDIKGNIQYNNKDAKIKWINNGRLKYGSIFTTENGLRTSIDQLEFNSQYNRVIDKELDFSTAFYMKTQVAPGYNYPNDSVKVSKFLNPGSFTLGLGVEYKPAKKTVLNYSPISYKNTFVLDTVSIDQTIHGIDIDKMANQEFGGQLVAKNSMTLLEGLDMSNTIRLFTNYFSKPINFDVDWEFNLEKRVNWYFTIGLNLHLIYDKDIKFPVLDDTGEKVLGPDDKPLKEPRVQFKEFIGLNFSFTF